MSLRGGRWLRVLALLTSAVLATACAGRIWPSVVGVRKGAWRAGEPLGNWSRSERHRDHEWQYNHPDRRAGEPGLCVAFSGGGLRAASFSIGVLAGLQERAVLREIDRASSVSGGGYALSWYLAHQYDAWRAAQDAGLSHDASAFDRELFARDGKYQQQLEGGTRIATNPFTTHRVDASTGQALTAFLLSAPMAAVNLLVNGVFGWHENTSPMRLFYQTRIERVFHRKPGTFSSLGLYDLGRGERIGFGDLRDLLDAEGATASSHLPFPIFVAAANLNHTSGSAALHVANRLFELTPKWSGSDAFGYRSERPVDMHKAVAISGAAVASAVSLSGPPSLFASALNMDLGYHVDNPTFGGSRAGYRLRPFPFYFIGPGWQNDLDGTRIHLTDGGHAENLGAYPLFRRLCRQTLIVDSTFDPNLGFDDYRVLKEALRAELELDLSIRPIDEWVRRQLAVSRVVRRIKREDSGDLDLRRRVVDDLFLLKPAWVETIGAAYELSDLEGEGWRGVLRALEHAIRSHLAELRERRGEIVPSFEDLRPDMAWLLLGPGPLAVKTEKKRGERWAEVLRAEVLEGELSGLERPEAGSDEEPAPLEVFYVKLSLPRTVRLDPKTCAPELFGDEACAYHQQKDRDFPQQETSDLSFEPEQFRAYRALGAKVGARFCLGEPRTDGWWSVGGTPWSRRPLTTDCAGD